MKKTALLFNVFLVVGLLWVMNTKAVMAGAHLSLSPSSGNYTVGQSFKVITKMTSGGGIIGGVDGRGTYDSTRLELVSIEKAPSFVFNTADGGGECNQLEGSGGTFNFSCGTYVVSSSNSSDGDVVVMNFKAKAVGTALVNFDCTQDLTTDSGITVIEPAVRDVIVCSENINGSYVISEGSDPEPEPEPEEEVEEEEKEELPQTGVVGATLGLILFGAVSVISAVFLKFL